MLQSHETKITPYLQHFSSNQLGVTITTEHLLISYYVSNVIRSLHCTEIKFFIKDFFSKCEQICRKLRVCLHLLKKFLMEGLFFRQCYQNQSLFIFGGYDLQSVSSSTMQKSSFCSSVTVNMIGHDTFIFKCATREQHKQHGEIIVFGCSHRLSRLSCL